MAFFNIPHQYNKRLPITTTTEYNISHNDLYPSFTSKILTMTFKCVQCPEMFLLERQWVDHLESEHGLVPVLLNPTVSDSSQMTKSDPSLSNPSTRPVDNIAPAPRQGVEPKVRFHVAYDLGRGDEVSPIRTTIPKDESYENFLRRLRYVFDGESFEISLRQWEYVLVNRQYERGDPLLLTSSNTYYAMVSELLRPRSTWRYAIIRRSVSVISRALGLMSS